MSRKALPSGTSVGMTPADEATARSLIMSLLYRYASLAREEGDHTATAKLFEADGVIQFQDGREIAPSDLGVITRRNPPKLLRHHLTTINIQFVSSEEVNCQSYIIAGSHLRMPDHWGRWDDTVRKQGDGTWLFKSKSVIVDGLDPVGWLAETIAIESSVEQE
ncbi:hypothetical protein AK830_g8347 [Neonectria ditissima]|uniref:SnoaL-like domain-containing protein n=1 Tax=Neonectria ditissima TaxID=78410 RepID=A0A0N8H679_9HYPO|nr:hypothetical protein AK830_g8347 [Neonectria ditissima]